MHNEPSAIEVYLKCNWYGRGVKVYVGHCESVHLCPATAVTAYDRQRPEPWSHSSEMRMALPWPVKLTKQLLFRPCTVS